MAYELNEVTTEAADNIIETRMPLGRFYCFDERKELWISIDNSSGDAFVEEFSDLINCIAYLELYT